MPEISERNFCDGLEMKFAPPLGGISCEKRYFLFLLAVSDYKRLDKSLYLIITNVHTELKPQAEVSNDMNSPAFALYTTFIKSWTTGKPYCFDQVRLKAEVRFLEQLR